MADENKNKKSSVSFGRGLLYAGLVGGGIVIASYTNIPERIKSITTGTGTVIAETYTKATNNIVDMFTEDLTEKQEKIFQYIKENPELVNDKEIRTFVDMLNTYRDAKTVTNEAVLRVVNDKDNYTSSISSIVSQTTPEQNSYINQLTYSKVLDQKTGYEFAKRGLERLDVSDFTHITLEEAKKKYSKEDFEKVIPALIALSGEKYGNTFDIMRSYLNNSFKDEKKIIEGAVQKAGELYDKGLEKGKEVLVD